MLFIKNDLTAAASQGFAAMWVVLTYSFLNFGARS
jgi:hypothetical protein